MKNNNEKEQQEEFWNSPKKPMFEWNVQKIKRHTQ